MISILLFNSSHKQFRFFESLDQKMSHAGIKTYWITCDTELCGWCKYWQGRVERHQWSFQLCSLWAAGSSRHHTTLWCSWWCLCKRSTWWALGLFSLSFLFSVCREMWAFGQGEVLWCWTPRNVILLTHYTVAPLMVRGECLVSCLLKSTPISCVFSTFKDQLLSLHHVARQLT